jgi:double-strand break repair protein AddB
VKVPDGKSARPRLYTIPPSTPFLTGLARAVLDGALPVIGGAKPDKLTLPQTTIYLPTRRAARGLRDAFLSASGGEALLLPRIRTLGDPDEDGALIFAGERAGESIDATAGAPTIGTLERRLVLMRLILARSKAERGALLAENDFLSPIPRVSTAAQASKLAVELARLMDFVESEDADLGSLATLVPEEFSAHWQLTVEFFKLITEAWPRYLADRKLVSPVARQKLLMTLDAERLAASPPRGPVIAAGSTGTVPATARLLQVIASLPSGAVVLPGLDLALDDESWDSVGNHPEHPQAGMAELLLKLGVAREEVRYLPGTEPDALQLTKLRFVSEALRPSDTTERWQDFLGEGADIRSALSSLQLVAAPTAQDEAEAIALILRSTIETKGKTAALVTPDRTLARRVAARLRGFGLAIDDSAGTPLVRTVPGAFLDLVLEAVDAEFAPRELMALLKYPALRLGRRPGEIRTVARALERALFRDVYIGHGLDGVQSALDGLKANGGRWSWIPEDKALRELKPLVADLKSAFAPLTDLLAASGPHSVAHLAEAHSAIAESLARDETGSSAKFWGGDAGEALSLLFAQLMAEGGNVEIDASEYPGFYRGLVANEAVRPRLQTHPRLFIWGPLEARLQQPDVLILGGLNEKTWPRPQDAGPWLSRPMLGDLNLPTPERRLGLSAHDFAQGLGAQTVYLTRALKVEGVATVPSRWLQRLTALAAAAKCDWLLAPEQPWVAWGRARDKVANFAPVEAPKPCPPLAARPRSLSVTRIERWIANPYEIFARDILKLEPLKPLGPESDAALRGTVAHRMLHDFADRHSDSLPAEIEAELIEAADRALASFGDDARATAFWRPQFRRFARWFASTERSRRAGLLKTYAEITGHFTLPVGEGFELKVRADRIDILEDGSAAIYDYKTGTPPKSKRVEELVAPQLPLEAAILAHGGFGGGLGRRTTSRLSYIYVSGRFEGGDQQDVADAAKAKTLAETVLDRLVRLIEHFDDPSTAYEVKRRPGTGFEHAYRYDAYEQLGRAKEWAILAADEDAP